MTDGTDRASHVTNGPEEIMVETLASRALGVLASKRNSGTSLLSERFLDELEDSVRSMELGRRETVVRDMIEARIRREDIVDFYIPEVARRMGARWCEDGLSFADVTIGVSRLQGLLRDLCSDWFGSFEADPVAPGIMVVVLADEFHTLGSMVLCSQLARAGVSVKLVVGRSESELLASVAAGHFDAILISAAMGEKVVRLRKLVEKIRAASVNPTPIVIGGSIVTREADVKTKTGADCATTDAKEALRACGLSISPPGARRRATSE